MYDQLGCMTSYGLFDYDPPGVLNTVHFQTRSCRIHPGAFARCQREQTAHLPPLVRMQNAES
jgi:hypothetical protein